MRGLRGLGRAMIGVAYRFEVYGIENVPCEGGVIVVMNHMSMYDWLFVGVVMSRLPRYVMYQYHF